MSKKTHYEIKKLESFNNGKDVRVFFSGTFITQLGWKPGQYVKVIISKDKMILERLVI